MTGLELGEPGLNSRGLCLHHAAASLRSHTVGFRPARGVSNKSQAISASQLLRHGCAPCAEGFGICQVSLAPMKNEHTGCRDPRVCDTSSKHKRNLRGRWRWASGLGRLRQLWSRPSGSTWEPVRSQLSGPLPELLSLNLWGWRPASPPGDQAARPHVPDLRAKRWAPVSLRLGSTSSHLAPPAPAGPGAA